MLKPPKAFDTNNPKKRLIISENSKDVTMDNHAGNQNNISLYYE